MLELKASPQYRKVPTILWTKDMFWGGSSGEVSSGFVYCVAWPCDGLAQWYGASYVLYGALC